MNNDDVWMAEVGDYGWSQICTSYQEATQAIRQYRSWLLLTGQAWYDRYNHWAIWKNGEYEIGYWPGYK